MILGLGSRMRERDWVGLVGGFWAGKAQSIEGVAQWVGAADLVNSPSFVLINEYRAGPRHGNMPIFHADLYRIESPDELASIGIEETWSGIGVCLIEWADQAGDWLPSERLAIHLQHLSETKRVLRFVPYGARYQALLAEFKKSAVA